MTHPVRRKSKSLYLHNTAIYKVIDIGGPFQMRMI